MLPATIPTRRFLSVPLPSPAGKYDPDSHSVPTIHFPVRRHMRNPVANPKNRPASRYHPDCRETLSGYRHYPAQRPENPDGNVSIEDLGSYYKLCAAYLRKNYTIKGDFIPGGTRLILTGGKEKLPAHYEEYFTDFFFVKPMNENETILTAGNPMDRYTCNMDHRLARFMIENAELLHSRVKGIFYEMIRILRDDYTFLLIKNMNRQISILRELPDHPFVIPDGLELTEADLC